MYDEIKTPCRDDEEHNFIMRCSKCDLTMKQFIESTKYKCWRCDYESLTPIRICDNCTKQMKEKRIRLENKINSFTVDELKELVRDNCEYEIEKMLQEERGEEE